MRVYEDLLASPKSSAKVEVSSDQLAANRRGEDNSVVENLSLRLAEMGSVPASEPESSFAGALRQRRAQSADQPTTSSESFIVEGTETRYHVLRRLGPLVQELETVSVTVAPVSRRQRMKMPAGVVSPEEWASLVRHCVRQ
jgi:hypothetical protein